MTTNEPVAARGQPVEATDEPVLATGQPVEATDEPVLATGQPVEATAEPVLATGQPVEATAEPVLATGQPVDVSGQPTEATAEDVAAEAVPAEATNGQMGAEMALPAGRYRIDADQTTVRLSVRKLGVYTVRGTVKLQTGDIAVADPLEESAVHAVIKADTFQTPNKKRDEHVKSAKFLSVADYPTIEFAGTGMAMREGTWVLSGTLTSHGQPHPATVTIDRVAISDKTAHLHAVTQIDRRDFGVSAMKVVIGPKIDVEMDIVAEAQG